MTLLRPAIIRSRGLLPRRAHDFVGLALIAFIAVAVLAWYGWRNVPFWTLHGYALPSGQLLLGSVLALAAFHARKQFPGRAWGSIALWLRVHLTVAFASLAIFAWHAGLHFPQGIFSLVLYCVFLGVWGSGLFGWWLSRTLPPRLSALNEETPLEQIPASVARLALETRELMTLPRQQATELAAYVASHVTPFLESPRPWLFYCFPTNQERTRIVNRLRDYLRFANEERRPDVRRLLDIVEAKDRLDHAKVLQIWLKGWLVVHIGLTYSLITLALFHTLVMLAFRGDQP